MYVDNITSDAMVLNNNGKAMQIKVYEDLLKEKDKEIERLNNKYNKALELLTDFNLPCEYDDFNTIAGLDYCFKYCSVDEEIYKKCWDRFIEWKLGSDKE